MKNQYRVFIIILSFVMFATSQCSAMPYMAGDYTVDVVVRNTAMNLVPDAKVTCYLQSSKKISVSVKAPGYIDQTYIVQAQENQSYYKHDFILNDLKKIFYITDRHNHLLTSAYVRLDQIGFAGNRFGMTLYVPIKSCPNLSDRDIGIFDTFWGWRIRHDFKLEVMDDFYKITLSMTRKAYKWLSRTVEINVSSAKNIELLTAQKTLKALKAIDADINSPMGSAQKLTEYIYKSVNKSLIIENNISIPTCLQKYYNLKDKFKKLHREF